MNHKKHWKNGGDPPFMDPAFVEALGGSLEKTDDRSTGRSKRKHEYKDRQLCRQAQRALNLALGECRQDLLREVYVMDVTPAAGRLIVHVVVPPHVPLHEALGHLESATGMLRAQVARSITRKRAPELTFVPAASDGELPEVGEVTS